MHRNELIIRCLRWTKTVSLELRYSFILHVNIFIYHEETRSRSRTQKQDLTIYWKQRSDSAYDSIVYYHVETRPSGSQARAEELNQSQSLRNCIVIVLFFRFSFQVPQSGSH